MHEMLFDSAAEKAVLGCMLLEQEAASFASQVLTKEDFYRPLFGRVFEVLASLVEQGRAVDVITAHEKLQSKKICSPEEATAELAALATSVPSAVNIKHYCSILAEKSYRRRAVAHAEHIKSVAIGKDISMLGPAMEAAEKDGIKNAGMRPLRDSLQQALGEVSRKMESGEKFTGLRTGFLDLDLLIGGLQDTELTVIAARPAMGKTAFALDILRNSAEELRKKNKIGVFFSLEMSEGQIALRMYSAELKVNNERFRFGTLRPSDFEHMERHTPAFETKTENIYIADDMGVTVQDVFSRCHSTKAAAGMDIGLIVIDYLQIMEGKGENRVIELSGITRGLKKLAKHFNCPVVALSQLSRSLEQRPNKRPMLSDLRESGSIEQDADIVAFLYRDEYYFPDTEKKNCAEVIVAKQRNGSTGTIELAFVKELTSFRSMERRVKA